LIALIINVHTLGRMLSAELPCGTRPRWTLSAAGQWLERPACFVRSFR